MDRKEYTIWNIFSYLGFCFASIAFLVFLNATQPFVLSDLLHIKKNIGNLSGTLAFADECLSIILCPLWGALSDKIGTRPIAVLGFIFCGISLSVYTSAKTVYPGLLLFRLLFAIGGSASTSMITAMLAEVSAIKVNWRLKTDTAYERLVVPDSSDESVISGSSTTRENQETDEGERKNGKLVGMVGVCSGLGAVTAATVLLPLPTELGKDGDAVSGLKESYHIVGGVALGLAVVLFFSLHKNSVKSIKAWISGDDQRMSMLDEEVLNTTEEDDSFSLSYFKLLKLGFSEARKDRYILLSYIGGFVARSASAGVALFIPLWVNLWFYQSGVCHVDVHDPISKIKQGCHEAYIYSSILTGIANLCALVFAPVWGLLADWASTKYVITISSCLGIAASIGFAFVSGPKSHFAFLYAAMFGAAQIGAIITSMSLCTGIKRQFSGSIAGTYSLFGGLGILVVTKLGGELTDAWPGSAFFILAVFFALYLGFSVFIS